MNCLKHFLRNSKVLTISSIRTCSNSEIQPIQYPGFTYYPRRKDFKDPPITPSKLFLVRRIKKIGGTTKEEKEYLKELNIFGKTKYKGNIAIVQNKPEINSLLWKVKHLVDIKPIFWKGELPKDGFGTFLRMTGELVISQKLKATEELIDLSEKHPKENHKMGRKYIKGYLLKKWTDNYF